MACTLPVFREDTKLKDTKNKHKNQRKEFYVYTKQPLVRPEVNIIKAVLIFIITIAVDVACAYGIVYTMSLFEWHNRTPLSFGTELAVAIIFVCLVSLIVFSKKIVIFVIRVYQKYAPYDIRSQCLFVPNCSEYMILAIEKYGLIKGIKKGIDRCRRCHEPNGGEDYP